MEARVTREVLLELPAEQWQVLDREGDTLDITTEELLNLMAEALATKLGKVRIIDSRHVA